VEELQEATVESESRLMEDTLIFLSAGSLPKSRLLYDGWQHGWQRGWQTAEDGGGIFIDEDKLIGAIFHNIVQVFIFHF
jgi:hypothetical protein